MMLRLVLCLLFALPGLAHGQEVISVFEVQNNTDATLRIEAVREEHEDVVPPQDVEPHGRVVLRLAVGNWRITARAIRARGAGVVERRFLLPDAGPYGIALSAADFGVTRLEDGPWTDLPPEEDTAEAAGLPSPAGRGVEVEYPPHRRTCEALTMPAVDPYFAFIPSAERCARPWAGHGFFEGRRVCRICPERTDWEAARGCCLVR